MTNLDRYEILDRIGEGAMGVVYRARDKTLDRVVALKIVSTELTDEDELLLRFRREAEAIGHLNHPNIITVYDMGARDDRLYLAMELLEGEDLRALVESRATPPIEDRARIMIEICEGLGYAHTRGIVHRDVKPANIILTRDRRVKLLDFGLARMASRPTITRQGVILGTPDYMSPEQATGRGIDHRSDVFSAGAVFYELLTLQKPFRGSTLHAVLYEIVSGAPEAILSLNPEVPARLAALVESMLEKEPERRPASLEDVRRGIERVPILARRLALRDPSTAEQERHRRVCDHVARGLACLDEGRLRSALLETRRALALDPASREAGNLLWKTGKRLVRKDTRCHGNASASDRIQALLARVADEHSEEDARQAAVELALLAPDDPRVVEFFASRVEK
jgi:serine/threonine-protein kinase